MKFKISAVFKRLLAPVVLAAVIPFTLPAPLASANVFSDLYQGLEQFSELPDQVNQLQESYNQTVTELEEAKTQLDQTKEQLDTYQSENAALQEQNRRLSQMIDELQDERAVRERYLHRLKVTVYTGLGLAAGYFVLTRIIRFGMRSRSFRR